MLFIIRMLRLLGRRCFYDRASSAFSVTRTGATFTAQPSLESDRRGMIISMCDGGEDSIHFFISAENLGYLMVLDTHPLILRDPTNKAELRIRPENSEYSATAKTRTKSLKLSIRNGEIQVIQSFTKLILPEIFEWKRSTEPSRQVTIDGNTSPIGSMFLPFPAVQTSF